MATDPELLDQFCDALWLEDGLSRNTLDGYRRDLRLFGAWLDRERHRTLLAAERADLLAYLAHKFQHHAKPRSAARLLSSLKRFYQYQLREGRLQGDPTLEVDSPKLPRALPRSLTEEDVDALLGAPDTLTPLGLRDKAMHKQLVAAVRDAAARTAAALEKP